MNVTWKQVELSYVVLKNKEMEIEDNASSIQGTTFEKLSIKGNHIILKNGKANYARQDGIMCFNKQNLKSSSWT